MFLTHFSLAFLVKLWCRSLPLTLLLFVSLFPNILRTVLAVFTMEEMKILDFDDVDTLGLYRVYTNSPVSHSVVIMCVSSFCFFLAPLLGTFVYKLVNTFQPRDLTQQVENQPPATPKRVMRIIFTDARQTFLQVSLPLFLLSISHLFFDWLAHASTNVIFLYPQNLSVNNPDNALHTLALYSFPLLCFLVEFLLFFAAYAIYRKNDVTMRSKHSIASIVSASLLSYLPQTHYTNNHFGANSQRDVEGGMVEIDLDFEDASPAHAYTQNPYSQSPKQGQNDVGRSQQQESYTWAQCLGELTFGTLGCCCIPTSFTLHPASALKRDKKDKKDKKASKNAAPAATTTTTAPAPATAAPATADHPHDSDAHPDEPQSAPPALSRAASVTNQVAKVGKAVTNLLTRSSNSNAAQANNNHQQPPASELNVSYSTSVMRAAAAATYSPTAPTSPSLTRAPSASSSLVAPPAFSATGARYTYTKSAYDDEFGGSADIGVSDDAAFNDNEQDEFSLHSQPRSSAVGLGLGMGKGVIVNGPMLGKYVEPHAAPRHSLGVKHVEPHPVAHRVNATIVDEDLEMGLGDMDLAAPPGAGTVQPAQQEVSELYPLPSSPCRCLSPFAVDCFPVATAYLPSSISTTDALAVLYALAYLLVCFGTVMPITIENGPLCGMFGFLFYFTLFLFTWMWVDQHPSILYSGVGEGELDEVEMAEMNR